MVFAFDAFLQRLARRGRALLRLPGGGTASQEDAATLSQHLLSRRGEASGVALAQLVLDKYRHASSEERDRFLLALAERFGVDRSALDRAIAAYVADPSDGNAQRVHEQGEPRRQELLRRLNLAPQGTAILVKMREDLLGAMARNPALAPADRDFMHLLASWFNRGFLELRRIDWNSPAAVLEKLIRYESVHAISGWDDLRGRLAPPDRRCFAFFHPRLTGEPLIFVEVALTREIPDAIGPLLASGRTVTAAEDAAIAVFYSISNTQKGLAGVSFGNFLIKQVVEDLSAELPGLTEFVTLSPVPGFARWLAGELRHPDLLTPTEAVTLGEGLAVPQWHRDAARREALRQPLCHAAAVYFLKAKTAKGLPVDPVARFHLGNGARLERINFLGDVSTKGLEQAHGLMVNYVYIRADIEKNHEAFAAGGEVVASSKVAGRLTKAEQPPTPARPALTGAPV